MRFARAAATCRAWPGPLDASKLAHATAASRRPAVSAGQIDVMDVACRQLRRGGGRDGGSVIEADAAEARQLHGRMAQIETGDQAEEIELDALDPAELDAQQAPQRSLRRRCRCRSGPHRAAARKSLPTAFGGSVDLHFRHRAQHRGDEGVAVRPGPHPVVAGIAVAVVRDRRPRCCGMSAAASAPRTSSRSRRGVAEPAAVRRPAVDAHRLAPADHVVAGPGRGVLGLEHDPAMDRENALPARRCGRS